MCDCTAALRHWMEDSGRKTWRQGSNITHTHTHTRIKSSSAIVSWDLQNKTSRALQPASGCHRRVGDFLFQLFWCSSHVIYITHTLPATPPFQRVCQPVKDCLGYPFIWNSSSTVSRFCPRPPASPTVVPTLRWTRSATQRPLAVAWTTTSAFKCAISSAQLHQNDAASFHATADLTVLWADRNNLSQHLVSDAIKGWP